MKGIRDFLHGHFYNAGLKVGARPSPSGRNAFGFGAITAIEFAARSRFIPQPKMSRRQPMSWHAGETVNMSIGQGARCW